MRSSPCVALLLGLAACSPALNPSPLVVTGFETRTVEVTAGVPIEWEATFRDETGTLVEPEELSLIGTPRTDALNPSTPAVLIEDEVLEPGRHRYRATAVELTTIRIGVEHRRLKVERCSACAIQQLEGLTLHVNPPAQELLSLSGTELSVGVGERRAAPAFPWGFTRGDLANSRIAWAWDSDVTMTSSDPAVARVDGARVVGVAPGQASVTLSAAATDGGVLRATLAVTVTDAGLGPPTEGLYGVFAQRIDSNEGGARHLQPPLYRQLHVDAAGNPVTVGVLFGNLAEQSMRWLPAMVGQWTGTGFETLRIGRAGEAVRAPRLVLDERGRRYVMYRDTGGRLSSSVVVADFDASATSREVRYRDLPVREEPRLYEEQHDVTTWVMDLAPRKGGGAWAAWVHLEGDLNSGPTICTVRVRLAELTDEGVRVQDLATTQTVLPKQTCNSYHVYKADEDEAAKLYLDVLTRPDEPPTVFLSGLPEFRSVRFAFESGQWAKSDVAETRHWPGGPLLEVADDVWPDGIVGDPEPYRLETDGRVWFGNEHPGVLLRGGTRFDDPTPRWFEGLNGERLFSDERRLWLTQGVTTSPGRIHQAISKGTELRYGVVELPERATPTSPETTGVRLADASAPWLPVGLAVAPSGARFVELRQQNASLATQPIGSAYNPWVPTFLNPRRVLRSPAPGLPFAEVTLPAGVQLWPQVLERGGKLWALGSIGGQLHVLSSTDGGQVFTSAFTQVAASAPVSVATVNGVFFALCTPLSGDSELWRFDVDVSGFAPRQLGTALRPGDGKLFSNGDGAVLIQRVAPNTVQLRRWDLAGTLAEDVRLAVPIGDIDFATVMAEGSTVWGLGRAATERPVLRRRAGETAFTAIGARDLRTDLRTPLLRLRPGVLGSVELKRTKRDCFQVALAQSEDEGATWSPERVLRPRGGCLQLPWGAALTSTGLAVALSDNDALRAWESADGVTQVGNFLFPAHDALFLHVPLP